jgi:hypothetical protein
MIKKFNLSKSFGKVSETNEHSFFDLKKGISIYLKILMNYLQSISIVQSLELKWPFYAKAYLYAYSNMGNVSTKTVSLGCILNDLGYNIDAIYVETIFTISIPFITFLVAVFLLMVINFVTKRTKRMTRMIVILIVSSIFLQPSIIRILYQNIVCKKIDEKNLLADNLNINCDDQNKW